MMRRLRAAVVALVLAVAGCSQPVPPGAQLRILYPKDGMVLGPDVELVVVGELWGPGIITHYPDASGGGRSSRAVPRLGIPTRVYVDGRPKRRLAGGSVHRLRLTGLSPGRHRITVAGLGLKDEITIEVMARPPLRFEAISEKPSDGVQKLSAALARAMGRTSTPYTVITGKRAVLGIKKRGDGGWALWRVDAETKPGSDGLPDRPQLVLESKPQSAACGRGIFAVMTHSQNPDIVTVHRLGPGGVEKRSWNWTEMQSLGRAQGLDVAPASEARLRCYGDAVVLAAFAAAPSESTGGGATMAALLAVGDAPAEVLIGRPQGGWRLLDWNGRIAATVKSARPPSVEAEPVWLGAAGWWLFDGDHLAPLKTGRPHFALPVAKVDVARGPRMPLAYALVKQALQRRWSLESGWPPRLRAAAGLEDQLFTITAAAPTAERAFEGPRSPAQR